MDFSRLVLILFLTSFQVSLIGCKSKDKPQKVQIGPVPYNQEWRTCKKASDCIYKQDSCKSVYFTNKKHEANLKELLNSYDKQVCVHLSEPWAPFKIVCDRGECSGVFVK